MLKQTIKGFFLFFTLIFIIMGVVNSFEGGEFYAPLIGTAFIIHFIGCVIDYIFDWHFDRRKVNLKTKDTPWFMRRQAD